MHTERPPFDARLGLRQSEPHRRRTRHVVCCMAGRSRPLHALLLLGCLRTTTPALRCTHTNTHTHVDTHTHTHTQAHTVTPSAQCVSSRCMSHAQVMLVAFQIMLANSTVGMLEALVPHHLHTVYHLGPYVRIGATHTRACSRARTRSRTLMHARTDSDTRTRTHARTHAPIHPKFISGMRSARSQQP